MLHWLLAIDESGDEAVIVSDKGLGMRDAYWDDDEDIEGGGPRDQIGLSDGLRGPKYAPSRSLSSCGVSG